MAIDLGLRHTSANSSWNPESSLRTCLQTPELLAALRFIFTKSLFARQQMQPFFSETEIVR